MMNLKEIKKKISEASDIELELVWLPKIMMNQTSDEKQKLDTISDNGVGLNKADSYVVTAIYNDMKKGNHLSYWQANKLRKLLPKYSRQYKRMMNNDSKSTCSS